MRVSRPLLGLAGALVVALLSLPATALAAGGGISGTVIGAGAGPLDGARVCARSDSSSFSFPCTSTDASGRYTIGNLEDGGYRVDFEGSGEFIGQWFEGARSEEESTDVAVIGGAITPSIDAELTKGAVLEGQVTDATTHAGLADVRACTSVAAGDPLGSRCATSDAGGHYRIVGIPTGEYKLRLEPEFAGGDPDYLTQFWPGGQNFAAGRSFSLTDGSSKAGVDAAMELGATISGKVVDEDGAPVSGLSVCTYPVLGNTNLGYCLENEGETGSDGTYTIRGLYSGEYKLHFFGATGNYLGQWYPAKPTRAEAAVVSVAAPAALTAIDATLQSGGAISGTLREAGSHDPIGLAEVCARPKGGTNLYCSQTKAGGEYSIHSLPTRGYVVEFAGPNSSTDWAYIPSFSGGTTDSAAAAAVDVSAGSETGGVDGEVAKGATISGQVIDALGHEPAFGIQACAYAGGKIVGHCDTTGDDGDYTIVGLPAGSYEVRFVPAGGGPEQDFRIGNEHYMDQVSEGAAAGETGVDAQMHEGGGISGTIEGPLGQPLRDGMACVVEAAEEEFGSHCAEADVDGEYEIEGLAPGSYRVRFDKLGAAELAPQYYEEVESFGAATAVAVTGTAVTPDIDARLVPGGTIEGTVTDAYDGSPVAGASVCAERVNGTTGNCAESGADGHYAMEVDPGSYRVRFSLGYEEFETEVAEFLTQYFDGATEVGAATPVTVAGGGIASGIDAALEPAGGRRDTVSVAKTGEGSGGVTSSPAGIECGARCSDSFETRKTVTLTPEPAPGSVFAAWTGACSGTGPCQIRLTGETDVAASFEPTVQSGSTSPATSSAAGAVAVPSVKRPLKCRRGLKKRKVGKHERCVRPKPKKKHRGRHRAKRR
jgi:hypothetical protein